MKNLHFGSVLDQFCLKLLRKFLLICDWVAEAEKHFTCPMSEFKPQMKLNTTAGLATFKIANLAFWVFGHYY